MQLLRYRRLAWLLAAAGLAASASLAAAQGRPDTRALSCSEAQALVKARGGVVLTTGPDIFDRYVSEIRYCSGFEVLKPEWVRTRDNPQCFIGYTCYVPTRDNFQR